MRDTFVFTFSLWRIKKCPSLDILREFSQVKKRKIENEKTEKPKEYEARCKERSFNQQWLVGRPWISFNLTENTMKTPEFLSSFSVRQDLVRSGNLFCLPDRMSGKGFQLSEILMIQVFRSFEKRGISCFRVPLIGVPCVSPMAMYR